MTSSTLQDFEQSLQRYLAEAKGHIAKMAIFAFVLCLLPLAPVLLKVEFLWLLILPLAAAAFVGKGLQSVFYVKQRAVESLKASSPKKMKVTALEKQFLWWNSVSSPGYKFDLAPINSGESTSLEVRKLKTDPANGLAVEKMKDLFDKFEQSKETNSAIPELEAEVYFDNKQMPVALLIDGELLWAAYWW